MTYICEQSMWREKGFIGLWSCKQSSLCPVRVSPLSFSLWHLSLLWHLADWLCQRLRAYLLMLPSGQRDGTSVFWSGGQMGQCLAPRLRCGDVILMTSTGKGPKALDCNCQLWKVQALVGLYVSTHNVCFFLFFLPLPVPLSLHFFRPALINGTVWCYMSFWLCCLMDLAIFGLSLEEVLRLQKGWSRAPYGRPWETVTCSTSLSSSCHVCFVLSCPVDIPLELHISL